MSWSRTAGRQQGFLLKKEEKRRVVGRKKKGIDRHQTGAFLVCCSGQREEWCWEGRLSKSQTTKGKSKTRGGRCNWRDEALVGKRWTNELTGKGSEGQAEGRKTQVVPSSKLYLLVSEKRENNRAVPSQETLGFARVKKGGANDAFTNPVCGHLLRSDTPPVQISFPWIRDFLVLRKKDRRV